MNKKYLLGICFFVLLSVTSLISALYHLHKKSLQNVLGSYTFALTKNNLYNLSKICITSADGNEFTFYYDSGIWRFEEAADYFVNDKMLNNFYTMVQNSILTQKAGETDKNPKNRINIKTYSVDGRILDNIYLEKNNYSLMSYADNNSIYKITHTENFSDIPEDWLPSPLLEINTDLISAVNFNGKYAERKTLEEVMQFSENRQNLYMALDKINYEGIMPDELFDSEYNQTEKKELKIYLRGGLNYLLKIFKDDENYYIRIDPQRELIARTEVNGIIRIKKMYYEGWTFILPPEQGAILYNADTFM